MCLPCYISPHHYARFIFLLAIRPSSSSSRRARRPRSSLSTDCLYRVLYQSTSLSISTCLYHIHLYQLLCLNFSLSTFLYRKHLCQLLWINLSLSQSSVLTSLIYFFHIHLCQSTGTLGFCRCFAWQVWRLVTIRRVSGCWEGLTGRWMPRLSSVVGAAFGDSAYFFSGRCRRCGWTLGRRGCFAWQPGFTLVSNRFQTGFRMASDLFRQDFRLASDLFPTRFRLVSDCLTVNWFSETVLYQPGFRHGFKHGYSFDWFRTDVRHRLRMVSDLFLTGFRTVSDTFQNNLSSDWVYFGFRLVSDWLQAGCRMISDWLQIQ